MFISKPLLVDEQLLCVDEGQRPRMLLFGWLGQLRLRRHGGHDDVSGDDDVQVFGRLLFQGLDGVLDREAAQTAATNVDDLVSDLQTAVTVTKTPA